MSAPAGATDPGDTSDGGWETASSDDEPTSPLFPPIPGLPPSSPGILSPPSVPTTPTRDTAPRLAALSSSGPIQTSPIRGRTKTEKAKNRKLKASKHQSTRMVSQHAARRAQAVLRPSDHQHAGLFQSVLDTLRARGTSFRELFFWIMDPVYKQGVARHNFLGVGGSAVDRALKLLQRSSNTARVRVFDWAVGVVSRTMQREAQKVTESKLLQTHHRPIDASFFGAFNLASLKDRLRTLMPTTTTIFTALAFRPKYAKKHGEGRQKRRSNVIFTGIVQGLSEWSQKNNLMKKLMSLYLYATGAQRQQIEVLSHLGITEAYSSLVDKRKRKKRKKKSAKVSPETSSAIAGLAATVTVEDIEHPDLGPDTDPEIRKGTVRQLSDSLKTLAQEIAGAILFGGIYDNVNFISRITEQIIGRTDAQENGTCATIFELWKARLEDMKAETLTEAFDKAAALNIDDILHSPAESQAFRSYLIWTILRIIIIEGGDDFKRFHAELNEKQPASPHKIEVHKTKIQPTPAWKIDQSSITGNAEFVEAFYEYLGIRTSLTFSTWVRLMIGDQLSIARLRSLLNIRAGQEGGANGFRNFVLVPGLFHAKIADTHGFFSTHWGKPNTGNRVPGSLWYHNTVIQRLPITLTSLPPFRTCRDLIWISLYARVLDCLLLVTGKESVDDIVTSKTTFAELLGHATAIYDRFLDMDLLDTLRTERAFAEAAERDPARDKKGDMVYENGSLFLRDALISREFADAIKCGDSGRVLLVLKIWALSYRGSGRTKYAYEMLSLIHHMTQVWPKPIVEIVMNNWLVNTTGHPNSFLEGDLLQEHMNFWIKNFYRAHGSNASWEWLEMLAPCVVVLRDLTRSLNGLLGGKLGTKHKSPDHTKDLAVLMNRLRQHEVHTVLRGRVIDPDDGGPTTDIIAAGLSALTDATTNPIDEYNTSFRLLQARCRLPVLVPVAPQAAPASPTRQTRQSPPESVNSPEQPTPMEVDEDGTEEPEEAPEPEVVDEVDEEDPETLTLDTEEDVALDMDEMGGVSDAESDASSGSSSDNGE